ncbi:hypothetical protein CBM2634_U120002 [Cupriavidus taiwanensis]|uniref:Uncharacterized protein n=1 Tax=Cupriavidus taiwanensis TaxID=164546 RepID=A0A375JC65_9BURK|nr:hypothetical protein CBM2634_U120002 [Cupriavidus taiwanensis]
MLANIAARGSHAGTLDSNPSRQALQCH